MLAQREPTQSRWCLGGFFERGRLVVAVSEKLPYVDNLANAAMARRGSHGERMRSFERAA